MEQNAAAVIAVAPQPGMACTCMCGASCCRSASADSAEAAKIAFFAGRRAATALSRSAHADGEHTLHP